MNTGTIALVVAVVALIIAVGGVTVSMGLIGDQRDVIVARGTLVPEFPCAPPDPSGCLSLRTIEDGSKVVYTEEFFFTESGDFPSHGNGIGVSTIDGDIITGSITGSQTGSLAGREGSFRYVNSFVLDLSDLTVEGSFVIVEGTGVGGLEGICGFGSFSGDVTQPVPVITVFAFGNDCENFDVGDFLDIVGRE